MTGARTLIVSFDAELDGDFQRAFCEGLGALAIPHADAGAIDIDPDSLQTIDIYLVSAARGGTGAYDLPDVVRIIGGPSVRETGGRALRLETGDIRGGGKRWAAVAERIGELAGRRGLGDFVLAQSQRERLEWAEDHPLDPLAADILESRKSAVLMHQLEAATRRADEAAAALQQLQRDAAVGAIDERRAKSSAASSYARILELEAENERLKDRLEHTTYALSHVPEDRRDCVEQARNAAARARMASAEASAAAEAYPGALVWQKAHAAYSGETRNKHPDGHGVMTFNGETSNGAFYRGEFVEGRREGYGVGRSEGGYLWAGQWMNDAACGLGVLEAPDGRRFEGEVAPSEIGPRPVKNSGHVWPARSGHATVQREPIWLRAQSSAPALPSK